MPMTSTPTSLAAAVNFYKQWFASLAGHPYYGPDAAIEADPGVQAFACYLAAPQPQASISPTTAGAIITPQQLTDARLAGFNEGISAASTAVLALRK